MLKKQSANPVQQKVFWIGVIIVVTLIVFFPTLFNNFNNWDDRVYINENPYIKALSWKNLQWIFSNAFMGNYHPLTMISLALDYQINEFNPFVFHLTNLLLHTGNAVLVFLIIYALTGKLNISVIAGLLFGVHTIHVESVSWVSERKDVLYAFFYLAALYSYIRFGKKKERKWYWFSIGFFILSLLSKGQAVSLAVTLFLVDYFRGKKLFDQKGLVDKIPYFILAVIFGIVAIKSQQGVAATEMVHTDGLQRILFASYGFLMYIGKLILPVYLSAHYPYPDLAQDANLPVIYFLAPLIIPAFLAALYLSYKKSKPLFFGLGFFLVNIFLVLQWLPVGKAIMADRYAYIPSIGYCFLFGYMIVNKEYLHNIKVSYVLVAIYILALSVMTFGRTQIWKTSFTLWNDIIEKNSNVPFAWYNLGNAHSDTANYKAAFDDYTQAISLAPNYYNAYINRAAARNKLNDYLGAIEDLDLVIKHDTTLVNAYIIRAKARQFLKDYSGALEDYDRAIVLNPQMPELYLNRGKVFSDMHENQRALDDYVQALNINPKMIDAYISRAVVYKLMNNMAAALDDYNTAIAVDPGNSGLYNNRGNIKVQMGNPQEAIADYSTSITLKPDDFLSYQNRGSIYYSLKQNALALSDFSQAIKLNSSFADLYITRAMIRKELNDIAGASNDFQKAVELNPAYSTMDFMSSLGLASNPDVAQNYTQVLTSGQVLESQGKFADAIIQYRKAIGIKPDDAEGWYALGTVYAKNRQFGEAINSFTKAMSYKKNYVQVMADRGIANASIGRIDEALKDLAAAIKMNPEYAKAYFDRAIVYLNTGKKDLACIDLQKAVQLGNTDAYAIFQKQCQGK